jgi:hypothetical protein
MTLPKAVVFGLLYGTLLVGLMALPFHLMHGLESIQQITKFFKFWIFVPSVVIGILVHEGIHGLTWAWAGKIPLHRIKYGFKLKTLTPYAHCQVPIDIRAYRTGVIMPFLIMGMAPYILSLVAEDHHLLGFGLFFSFGAIGDLIILWITRTIPSGTYVQDHATQAGVTIVDQQASS